MSISIGRAPLSGINIIFSSGDPLHAPLQAHDLVLSGARRDRPEQHDRDDDGNQAALPDRDGVCAAHGHYLPDVRVNPS